ncbi:hypothetical protein C8R43DRAFT_1161114 [Mycena crocata]|nr:hypothetical protein C8R43DRAFT_1161114 [Mycena crocata]
MSPLPTLFSALFLPRPDLCLVTSKPTPLLPFALGITEGSAARCGAITFHGFSDSELPHILLQRKESDSGLSCGSKNSVFRALWARPLWAHPISKPRQGFLQLWPTPDDPPDVFVGPTTATRTLAPSASKSPPAEGTRKSPCLTHAIRGTAKDAAHFLSQTIPQTPVSWPVSYAASSSPTSQRTTAGYPSPSSGTFSELSRWNGTPSPPPTAGLSSSLVGQNPSSIEPASSPVRGPNIRHVLPSTVTPNLDNPLPFTSRSAPLYNLSTDFPASYPEAPQSKSTMPTFAPYFGEYRCYDAAHGRPGIIVGSQAAVSTAYSSYIKSASNNSLEDVETGPSPTANYEPSVVSVDAISASNSSQIIYSPDFPGITSSGCKPLPLPNDMLIPSRPPQFYAHPSSQLAPVNFSTQSVTEVAADEKETESITVFLANSSPCFLPTLVDRARRFERLERATRKKKTRAPSKSDQDIMPSELPGSSSIKTFKKRPDAKDRLLGHMTGFTGANSPPPRQVKKVIPKRGRPRTLFSPVPDEFGFAEPVVATDAPVLAFHLRERMKWASFRPRRSPVADNYSALPPLCQISSESNKI